MHQPAAGGIECVAPMHRTAVVPPYQIAYPPFLAPGEFFLDRMRPEEIEQRVALLDRDANVIGVDPATDEEGLLASLGVGAHHRLARPRHYRHIGHRLEPEVRLAAA